MNDEAREIMVGENRIYLGEDNVLDIINVGEIDEKTAIAMKEAIQKLMNMAEGTVYTLTDLTKAGKTTPEARKVFKTFIEPGARGKIAYLGMSPVARVLAYFVMGSSRKEDMRFFKTREEALAWLKE